MRYKNTRPRTKAEETPEFREFWAVWLPYMNVNYGGGDARTAFLRHVEETGADPLDIVDGARWWVRNGGNQGVDYGGKPVRIHAQTWIFKCAYEDYCEQERAYRARQEERTNVVQMQQPKPARKTAFLELFESGKATG